MRKFSVYVATASAVLAIAGASPAVAWAGTVSYNIPAGRITVIGGNGNSAGCSQGTQSIRDILGGTSGGNSCGSSGNTGSGNTCNTSGNTGSGNTCNTSGNNQLNYIRPGINRPNWDTPVCDSGNSQCPDILTPNLPNLDCPDNQNPGTTNPGTTNPGTTNPGTTNPGITNPGTTNPGTTNPGITNPGTTNPGTTNPGTTKPGTQLPDASDDYALQVVELVNAERAKAGLSPLSLHNGAADAALVRAQELKRSFSHTRPDGSNCNTALDQAGISYRGYGENIAYGQRSAEEVMQGWMNSSGHRANILNRSFTSIGVGHYKDSSGTDYWCQLFLTE